MILCRDKTARVLQTWRVQSRLVPLSLIACADHVHTSERVSNHDICKTKECFRIHGNSGVEELCSTLQGTTRSPGCSHCKMCMHPYLRACESGFRLEPYLKSMGGSMEVCNQRRGRRVLPIDNARALSSGLVHPSVVKTCGLCSLELRNAASGSFVVWGCRTWCWCSMRTTGTGSLFTWVPIASMLTLVRYV